MSIFGQDIDSAINNSIIQDPNSLFNKEWFSQQYNIKSANINGETLYISSGGGVDITDNEDYLRKYFPYIKKLEIESPYVIISGDSPLSDTDIRIQRSSDTRIVVNEMSNIKIIGNRYIYINDIQNINDSFIQVPNLVLQNDVNILDQNSQYFHIKNTEFDIKTLSIRPQTVAAAATTYYFIESQFRQKNIISNDIFLIDFLYECQTRGSVVAEIIRLLPKPLQNIEHLDLRFYINHQWKLISIDKAQDIYNIFLY